MGLLPISQQDKFEYNEEIIFIREETKLSDRERGWEGEMSRLVGRYMNRGGSTHGIDK